MFWPGRNKHLLPGAARKVDWSKDPARPGDESMKAIPNKHSAWLETSVANPPFAYRIMYDRSKEVNSGSVTAGCILF